MDTSPKREQVSSIVCITASHVEEGSVEKSKISANRPGYKLSYSNFCRNRKRKTNGGIKMAYTIQRAPITKWLTRLHVAPSIMSGAIFRCKFVAAVSLHTVYTTSSNRLYNGHTRWVVGIQYLVGLRSGSFFGGIEGDRHKTHLVRWKTTYILNEVLFLGKGTRNQSLVFIACTAGYQNGK